MADTVLSDGREIAFDLYKITVREWDKLRDPTQPRAEEIATLAKTCELSESEIYSLPYPDYVQLTRAFVVRSGNPIPESTYGKEIVFDLYQITIRDWDKLRDPTQPRAEEIATLAKTCELSESEIYDLPYPDYVQLTRAFVERCRNPLPETPST